MITFSVIGTYTDGQIVCDSVQAKDGASAIKKTYKLEERKGCPDFRVIAAIPGEDLGITFNDLGSYERSKRIRDQGTRRREDRGV